MQICSARAHTGARERERGDYLVILIEQKQKVSGIVCALLLVAVVAAATESHAINTMPISNTISEALTERE